VSGKSRPYARYEWGALAVLGGYSVVLLLLASRTLAEVE
jgi:hypothetical protein